MERKDLSLETHGILIKGQEISTFLKKDLERLVARSLTEQGYLERAHILIEDILLDQNAYREDWLIEDAFDEQKLFGLLLYIRSIQQTPAGLRLYAQD